MVPNVRVFGNKHNALIHIHSGAEAVKWMFKLEPSLTIIWAHVGMTEPPEVIEPMFAQHERLYADTSYRELEILGNGENLEPAWRDLILKYPDRLMVGSDTWVNHQWAMYGELIENNLLICVFD